MRFPEPHDRRPFKDRHDAGRRLGQRLRSYAATSPIVVGIARGGVAVAYEVAQELEAALDLTVARKIGAPANPEFGIGAIAEGGVLVLDDEVVRRLGITDDELSEAIGAAKIELLDRLERYQARRAPIDVEGRTVILIDDGLATGNTARAALRALRSCRPERLVLAVPVGSREAARELASECDEVICLLTPEPMEAVGYGYERFTQTSDEEVRELLAASAPLGTRHAERSQPTPDISHAEPPSLTRTEVQVPTGDGHVVHADLSVPDGARGIVVFAHGSGSSRHSPRNQQVAAALHQVGLATLLVDLLTRDEERQRANVFDIELLANRLVDAVAWLREQPPLASLGVGFFGASTGGGAALWAAAELGDVAQAVVSRGGRPDLAMARLSSVRSPTLLIVGGDDPVVLALNREARAQLRCEAKLEIVPGATHLFEELGALETVAKLAGDWLGLHLHSVTTPTPQGA